MALLKLEDFDADYRNSFEGKEIKGDGVYTESDEKIGTVDDILVDEEGRFRYFIVDLGFWIFGKKVLLPVGRTRVDHTADRVYAIGMTRDQADNLPEFNNIETIDYDYEERVRGSYRTPNVGASVSPAADYRPPINTASLETNSASMTGASAYQGTYSDEASAPEGVVAPTDLSGASTYDRDAYNYHQEPSLYNLNDRDHQTLRLYEERLIANKQRVKTGEVAIGKHIETETARVAVPVEKERVVIERVTPASAGQPVAPGEATFREGEVAHMEIYEETPDIHKEAVLREEVRIRKEVERDTVETQETIRKEELDIDSAGTPVVDASDRLPKDRI